MPYSNGTCAICKGPINVELDGGVCPPCDRDIELFFTLEEEANRRREASKHPTAFVGTKSLTVFVGENDLWQK